MKKVNVIVKDKNTLVLSENAEKDDIIDLSSLSSIDTSSIEATIADGKDKVYESRLDDFKKTLELEKKNALSELENKYSLKLNELQNKLNNFDSAKKSEFEIKEMTLLKDKESALFNQKASYEEKINQLNSKIAAFDAEKKLAVNEAISTKDNVITKLNGELALAKEKSKSDIDAAINKKNQEILELQNSIELEKNKNELNEKSLKEQFANDLKRKDEEIAFYKDLKARQSTKMVGESLEQHCLNEFNKLRMTAFPTAYFEKDNKISETGSKGDFIYRECDSDGTEIISIMFEMKNEMDSTEKKHKNEDFFKELDKDRIEKKCEYAVLVSLLEADNDYYNNGIVDVSYVYNKMYVIRPQFFIPIITLLRNAAMNTLEYKKQVEEMKNQNIDITNFENKMNEFKEAFGKNYNSAVKNFEQAITEIDKSIADLERVKKSLTTSANQLRLANNKTEDLTIRKLTYNNPTMKAKFEESK